MEDAGGGRVMALPRDEGAMYTAHNTNEEGNDERLDR